MPAKTNGKEFDLQAIVSRTISRGEVKPGLLAIGEEDFDVLLRRLHDFSQLAGELKKDNHAYGVNLVNSQALVRKMRKEIESLKEYNDVLHEDGLNKIAQINALREQIEKAGEQICA